jgi:cytochrome oxidase Cu insertion factor (SCO1/SenC/PrrC family)
MHISSAFEHWDFASTSVAELGKLAVTFAMQCFDKDKQISHTQNTVLIAPEGTVAITWPGNEWPPVEVLEVLRHSLVPDT